jgi:hypothetical protein
MTIVFHQADGGKRILRPTRHINLEIIKTLAWDFKATRWEIK